MPENFLSKGLFLWVMIWIVAGLPVQAGTEQTEPSTDKINLALRRTADKLLRATGDSTSRIPAVRQISEKTWRIDLEQAFSYDTLPYILQASLDLHGIGQTYEVAIRQCESFTIDLGYHQSDFLQDSMVPCGGRIAPEGCHYIDITFLMSLDKKEERAQTGFLLILALLIVAGGWWLYRQRSRSKDLPPDTQEGEWLAFGHSRLHLSGQVLECGHLRHTLTYREAKLLRLFASHPDQLLERDLILRQVWADEGVQVGRSIDMFVSRLRKKLKSDPTVNIVAVHGVGYKMETGVQHHSKTMIA